MRFVAAGQLIVDCFGCTRMGRRENVRLAERRWVCIVPLVRFRCPVDVGYGWKQNVPKVLSDVTLRYCAFPDVAKDCKAFETSVKYPVSHSYIPDELSH